MPTTPIIIPLIVTGLFLGSLLGSQTRKISKKRLLGVSVVAGFLNTANAYLVYTLFPPTTFPRFEEENFAGGAFTGSSTAFQLRATAAGANSEASFLLVSFVTGLLIVLVVVGIAVVYARRKSVENEEPTEEDKQEEI